MRILLFILFFTVIQQTAWTQKISYTIPGGYERDIRKEDYRRLVDISIPIISKRFQITRIENGAVQLTEGAEMHTLNLHNLILKCVAEKNKSKWNEVIEAHFNNLFASLDEQKKIVPENYEAIKKYLSLRIYPAEMVAARGGTEALVVKTDLEGTYTLLMLDLPGAFTAVQKSMFALWNQDTAAVFKVAQANVNSQQIEKVTQLFEIDGSNIEISFIGNEDYAASYALDLLHHSPELVGEWGSVLAMPNKGLVSLCKVSKEKPLDFVKYIQRTMPRTIKSFQEHPQPVSDQYFWYYKGKFTRIAVIAEANGNINVISPFGLTELMTTSK